MSAINFGDSEYEGGKTIFNNGQAGVANNVTLEVVKKASDDTTNGPEYNFVFTDASGAQIRRAFWYADPNSQWFEANVTRDGKVLKHVIKLLKGAEFANSMSFKDHKEMLDKSMEVIRDNVKGKSFAIFCNYGTPQNQSEYLSVRKFTPFITQAGAHESLVETPYDQMSRPQASQAVSEEVYGDVAADSGDKSPW